MPTPDKDGQNIPQVSVKLSLGMCYKGEGSPFSESLFLPGSALRRGLAAWTRLFCESGRAGTGVQVSCWPPGAPPWHTLPPWPSENLLQEQRLVLPPCWRIGVSRQHSERNSGLLQTPGLTSDGGQEASTSKPLAHFSPAGPGSLTAPSGKPLQQLQQHAWR